MRPPRELIFRSKRKRPRVQRGLKEVNVRRHGDEPRRTLSVCTVSGSKASAARGFRSGYRETGSPPGSAKPALFQYECPGLRVGRADPQTQKRRRTVSDHGASPPDPFEPVVAFPGATRPRPTRWLSPFTYSGQGASVGCRAFSLSAACLAYPVRPGALAGFGSAALRNEDHPALG